MAIQLAAHIGLGRYYQKDCARYVAGDLPTSHDWLMVKLVAEADGLKNSS